MPATLRILGQPAHPLERVAHAGQLVGLESKSTAYRLAEADSWPMTGRPGNQWVLMIPLCARLGIPVEVASAELEEVHDGRP